MAVALPAAAQLRRVRRLVASGHDRRDLVEALELDLARRREELAFVYGPHGWRIERALCAVTFGALGIGVAAVGLAEWAAAPTLAPYAPWVSGAAAAVALLAAAIARGRAERRTDPKAARRLAFWRGTLGRWLFRLAQGGRVAGDAAARRQGRSAAVSLGVVGDRFFHAFPQAPAGAGGVPPATPVPPG
jgi:hypothetical protein